MAISAGCHRSDADWLADAIELSKRCPPTDWAFCVGAILVSESGQVVAQGYSRRTNPKDHAEEAALAEAAGVAGAVRVGGAAGVAGVAGAMRVGGADLSRATLYTSLEPCLRRVSRPVSCAELIVRSGVRRVVYAWREPPIFQPGGGADWLREHSVVVIEVPELATAAQAVNSPVLQRHSGHSPASG